MSSSLTLECIVQSLEMLMSTESGPPTDWSQGQIERLVYAAVNLLNTMRRVLMTANRIRVWISGAFFSHSCARMNQ